MARVLVVDDEEGFRSFLVETLEAKGHDVDQAADGAEAVVMLKRRGYQVLVTDLKMPGVDGMGLLSWLQANQPEVEAVMITAHGSVSGAVEAMKQGAFDYLEKPIESPDALRLVVERAAERFDLKAMKELEAGGEPLSLTYGAPVMEPVVEALRKVSVTDATVLLEGESGTGKEVAARAVHRWSDRGDGPFVAVNCAALSETLLESELFGHEKGAFTGASDRRRGKVELADGGTFFLDEVGELKPALQAKFLRMLQEKSFERLGGDSTIQVDVRWVAATNRDLKAMVLEGSFREDLYHRLAVFPVRMPPLRERRQDIPGLADALLKSIGERIGRPGLAIDAGALELLAGARWPGNIRELANALERAAILSGGTTLDAGVFSFLGRGGEEPASSPRGVKPLEELEKEAIGRALGETGGNRRKAAELLGIGLRTLYDKLSRYGLK